MNKTERSMWRFFKVIGIHDLKSSHYSPHYGNLSFSTSKYLDILSFSENNTVSEIAQALGITKSAVTIKMNDLEKQGLIKRVQSKTDKRMFYISLTDNISDQFEKSDVIFEKIFEETSKKFSQDELEIFSNIVDFMAEKIEKATHKVFEILKE